MASRRKDRKKSVSGSQGQTTAKRLSRTNRRRLLLVFFFVIICFAVLSIRLLQIDLVRGETYQRNVMSVMNYDGRSIPYQRGQILDRNGSVLASSEKIYSLVLDPYVINNSSADTEEETRIIESTVQVLKEYFGIDEEQTRQILTEQADDRYVVLKKGLSFDDKEPYDQLLKSEDEEEKAMAARVKNGIWFEESYKRNYPYSTLACDVIGFAGSDGTGLWGLENYYDKTLSGINGRDYSYIDNDVEYQTVSKEPVNGCSLVTTIDVNIQRIVEKYVEQFELIIGAENVGVVVMNPNNGEVLAMANGVPYDLNEPYDLTRCGYTAEQVKEMSDEEQSEALMQIWRNFCVNDSYEPGSTFKPFTVTYALDHDLTNTKDTFDCDGGEEYEDGTYVYCNNFHGTVSLEESVMYSCNDAMMELSRRMGISNFVTLQHMFGFGMKTGIDLTGEASCENLIFTEDTMGPVELWTSSFGQGFNTTMVQMASAFCSIVNGGSYYMPHVVKEIVDDNGSTVEVIDKTLMRKTISQKSSDWILQALYETVENGTGTPAHVPGYKVGGKTGTSEVLGRENELRLVSFESVAPIDDPQVVVYVVIDRMYLANQGQSQYASAMCGHILSEVLPYLQIFPTEEIGEYEAYSYEYELMALEEEAAAAKARGNTPFNKYSEAAPYVETPSAEENADDENAQEEGAQDQQDAQDQEGAQNQEGGQDQAAEAGEAAPDEAGEAQDGGEDAAEGQDGEAGPDEESPQDQGE